jgi:hypothetical protein
MISGVSCFRAFIGIAVPDSVRDQLVTVENHLKQSDAHVSWVRRENLHISLAFLGNVTRDTAELLALGLDAATARSQTFSCEAVGLGAFGRPDRLQAPAGHATIRDGRRIPVRHPARRPAFSPAHHAGPGKIVTGCTKPFPGHNRL